MRDDQRTSEGLGAAREETAAREPGQERPGSGPERSARTVELRPRGVGELLDLAIELLVARPMMLLGIAFACTLIALSLQAGAQIYLVERVDTPRAMQVLAWIGVLLPAGVPLVASAVTGLTTIPWLRGERRSSGIFLRTLRALPALLVVAVLTFVIVFAVAVPTCGIAAIFFWWRLSLAPMAIVVERKGPIGAIRRSWEMTREGFGRWVGLFIGMLLLGAPLSIGQQYAVDGTLEVWLLEKLPDTDSDVVYAITVLVASLASAVPTALAAAAVAVFYADVVVRREAWDLRVRLEELQARPPLVPATATPSGPGTGVPGTGSRGTGESPTDPGGLA